MRLFLLLLWLASAALAQPTTHFVEVDPGVRLEVLDWGGHGEPLVLLTGLGDNAHVYEHFAWQFTDRYRVLAITRRGYGRSSHPATGYDVDTRARDDARVLEKLGLPRAIFIGHSMAGDELSELGAGYPERVSRLVYLDAYDYGAHKLLPQPPAPDYTDRDLQSLELFSAAQARFYGSREPEAAMRETYRFDASGRVIGTVFPQEVPEKMKQGSKVARYAKIQAPVLAILAPLQPLQPFYPYLTPAQKAAYDTDFPPIVEWQKDAIQRMRTGIRNLTVLELPGAYHYIYLNNEAFVVEAIRSFLTKTAP